MELISAVLLWRGRGPDLSPLHGRSVDSRTVNRVLAHVMELGLFLDSPRLVSRAQADLLRENLASSAPDGGSCGMLALLLHPVSSAECD